jgi:hypothetical protein
MVCEVEMQARGREEVARGSKEGQGLVGRFTFVVKVENVIERWCVVLLKLFADLLQSLFGHPNAMKGKS